MKIIDRYILKEITIPIFFCLYILIFLFLIADLFDHLSEIITSKVPLSEIATYYLYLIPFAIVQTISWATFMGLIYIFTNLTRHGEMIAMKSCGLKITKIATPIIFMGLVLGVVTFVINDRVVPYTYRTAENIKKEKIEISSDAGEKANKMKNVTLLSDNRQYFAKEFDISKKTLTDIRIHFLDDTDSVKRKVVARKAQWINNEWVFEEVTISNYAPNGHMIGDQEVSKTKIFPECREKPKDFIDSSIDVTFLSSKELQKHITRLRDNGLNTNAEMTILHQKRSSPWESLVIMFITIPILGKSGNARKSLAKHILACLILVFAFHVSTAIFLALGNSGFFLPSLSAWLSNIIFTLSGIILLERANY